MCVPPNASLWHCENPVWHIMHCFGLDSKHFILLICFAENCRITIICIQCRISFLFGPYCSIWVCNKTRFLTSFALFPCVKGAWFCICAACSWHGAKYIQLDEADPCNICSCLSYTIRRSVQNCFPYFSVLQEWRTGDQMLRHLLWLDSCKDFAIPFVKKKKKVLLIQGKSDRH